MQGEGWKGRKIKGKERKRRGNGRFEGEERIKGGSGQKAIEDSRDRKEKGRWVERERGGRRERRRKRGRTDGGERKARGKESQGEGMYKGNWEGK